MLVQYLLVSPRKFLILKKKRKKKQLKVILVFKEWLFLGKLWSDFQLVRRVKFLLCIFFRIMTSADGGTTEDGGPETNEGTLQTSLKSKFPQDD